MITKITRTYDFNLDELLKDVKGKMVKFEVKEYTLSGPKLFVTTETYYDDNKFDDDDGELI